MSIEYIGFDFSAPEGDNTWKSGEYPSYSEGVFPLLRNYAASISKVILISNSHLDVNKKKLVKVADRLSIDRNVVEFPKPDWDNKRLMEFINIYAGYRNELNLLFQSSDLALLREFFYLFPKPFRERIDFHDDLGSKPHDIEDIKRVIAQLDEESFLISSALEGCMFCILAHEPIRKLVLSWE